MIDVTGIVDDRVLEGDETVIVTITGTNNLGAYPADSPNNTATVTIQDNESVQVGFQTAASNASEGVGTTNVPVVLTILGTGLALPRRRAT